MVCHTHTHTHTLYNTLHVTHLHYSTHTQCTTYRHTLSLTLSCPIWAIWSTTGYQQFDNCSCIATPVRFSSSLLNSTTNHWPCCRACCDELQYWSSWQHPTNLLTTVSVLLKVIATASQHQPGLWRINRVSVVYKRCVKLLYIVCSDGSSLDVWESEWNMNSHYSDLCE